ncbi:allantoinase AllB [soil metagenome]
MRPAMVVVAGSRIESVLPYDDELLRSPTTFKLDGVLMPGLVDIHVHLNEPGREQWEGFETGTAAARLGGFTTLIDMPLNSSPTVTTIAGLKAKRDATIGKLRVNVGFHAGLIAGNSAEVALLIEEPDIFGVKAFLCDSGIDEFPAAREADLRAVMPLLAARGIPLLVHAEIVPDGVEQVPPSRRYADYLASRPDSYELDAISLMVSLCRETKCHVHIVHLATAKALPMLRAAKAEVLPLTIETCPHYLAFAAEDIPDGATQFKCAPPIRSAENRDGLWEGLRDGTIDSIASDHSPCPPEMKHLDSGIFQDAWGGISSLQYGLSIIAKLATERGFTIVDVARWMSENPSRIINVAGRKGRIDAGYDADLILFEADHSSNGDKEEFERRRLHRHKLTPYRASDVPGRVTRVWIGGSEVMPGEILQRSEVKR